MAEAVGKRLDIVRQSSFYTNILILSVPIILQQLLRVSVDTIDSIMLGRTSQLQMAAVTQAKQIFFIFYTVCSGFAAGASVLVSQYWGKNETDKIKTLFATGVKAVSIFAVITTVLTVAFSEQAMRVFSSDAEIIAIGSRYLRLSAAANLPCAISVVLFACCRGIEQMGISFAANAISYPLNIFLNWCFIFGKFGMPEMGIEGAALGTIIARLAELAVLAWFIFVKEKKVGLVPRDFLRNDKRLSRLFLIVSLPILAHEIIWSTGTSAGSAITGQMGENVVAGFSVAYILYQVTASFMNSIMFSCSVVVGKEIGGGSSLGRLKTVSNSMLLIGIVCGALLGVLTMATAFPFMSLYTLNAEAGSYAFRFIVVFALIWPFSGVEMTGLIATLRAGGDGKTGFITDIFSMWLITIPLALLAGFVFDAPPVLVIVIIKFNIVIEAAVGIVRVRSMKWVKNLTAA